MPKVPMHEHMGYQLGRNETITRWIVQAKPIGDVDTKSGPETYHSHKEQAINDEQVLYYRGH